MIISFVGTWLGWILACVSGALYWSRNREITALIETKYLLTKEKSELEMALLPDDWERLKKQKQYPLSPEGALTLNVGNTELLAAEELWSRQRSKFSRRIDALENELQAMQNTYATLKSSNLGKLTILKNDVRKLMAYSSRLKEEKALLEEQHDALRELFEIEKKRKRVQIQVQGDNFNELVEVVFNEDSSLDRDSYRRLQKKAKLLS